MLIEWNTKKNNKPLLEVIDRREGQTLWFFEMQKKYLNTNALKSMSYMYLNVFDILKYNYF